MRPKVGRRSECPRRCTESTSVGAPLPLESSTPSGSYLTCSDRGSSKTSKELSALSESKLHKFRPGAIVTSTTNKAIVYSLPPVALPAEPCRQVGPTPSHASSTVRDPPIRSALAHAPQPPPMPSAPRPRRPPPPPLPLYRALAVRLVSLNVLLDLHAHLASFPPLPRSRPTLMSGGVAQRLLGSGSWCAYPLGDGGKHQRCGSSSQPLPHRLGTSRRVCRPCSAPGRSSWTRTHAWPRAGNAAATQSISQAGESAALACAWEHARVPLDLGAVKRGSTGKHQGSYASLVLLRLLICFGEGRRAREEKGAAMLLA
ncbi:hypothetical protein C2845_PM05G05240 [Panicum miliaceum]|uniref:Uncharacterized protein n=1 Tax=Panicum miliaceum TaxID=4540 RepID=A0A3L6T6H7_PANMI|nr:hypothetical protein C2845_PM05G05240 [Panicum miliaceum]